jgi:hypothetical protein
MKLPSKDQGRRIHTNRGYSKEDEETELIDVLLSQELERDRGSIVDDCIILPAILEGGRGGRGGRGGVAGI